MMHLENTKHEDGSSSTKELIKSAERVREIGEVFTPPETVNEMLDLLPAEIWAVHPSPTFLEPACGDGNFLVAILERKFTQITTAHKQKKLLAGTEVKAARFHALEALASIYGIDISVDNIVGGTPGHEVGARTRLLNIFGDWNEKITGKKLTNQSSAKRAAEWIVGHNIFIANMLPLDVNGEETGRDVLPIIEYKFNPLDQTVKLFKTYFSSILTEGLGKEIGSGVLALTAGTNLLWEGKVLNLDAADKVKAPKLKGSAFNGVERN